MFPFRSEAEKHQTRDQGEAAAGLWVQLQDQRHQAKIKTNQEWKRTSTWWMESDSNKITASGCFKTTSNMMPLSIRLRGFIKIFGAPLSNMVVLGSGGLVTEDRSRQAESPRPFVVANAPSLLVYNLLDWIFELKGTSVIHCFHAQRRFRTLQVLWLFPVLLWLSSCGVGVGLFCSTLSAHDWPWTTCDGN